MTLFGEGAEEMRRACSDKLAAICQRWADKELEARQSSRHDLEDGFMRSRLAVAECLDAVRDIIMEDKGYAAMVPAPKRARFYVIGNEIWERDQGGDDSRIAWAEGPMAASVVRESLERAYDEDFKS